MSIGPIAITVRIRKGVFAIKRIRGKVDRVLPT